MADGWMAASAPRQVHGEGAPLSLPALERHVAVARQRVVLDDREPEPGASDAAAAGLVDPVEPLEDPLLVALRDPDAVVLDLDPHLALVVPERADPDVPAVGGVGRGVRREVADDGGERL